MSESSRLPKILIGCALGCGTLLLLLVGSCIGFMAWLKSPGELLEPATLLDAEATGYVECRLTLDDSATRLFVEEALAAIEQSEKPWRDEIDSPFVDFFINWNRRKQRRDIERLFPLHVVWTGRPGETPEEDLNVFSVSAKGMSHQLMFMDWILGFFARRSADGLVAHEIGEELVYEMGDESGPRVFLFLGAKGLVVTFDLGSASRAVELVRRDGDAGSRSPTQLERLVATVPDDQPLRGGVLNGRGELGRLVQKFSGDAAEIVDWTLALADVSGATVVGHFVEGEGVAVTVELEFVPGASDAERQAVGDSLLRLAERLGERVELTTRETDRGLAIDGRIVGLIGALGEAQREGWEVVREQQGTGE